MRLKHSRSTAVLGFVYAYCYAVRYFVIDEVQKCLITD